jgi:hypothetical protein
MTPTQLFFVAVIAVLIALGIGSTIWTAWRRRHIDRAGGVKGVPSDPPTVRAQNPPDRHRREGS